MAAFSLCPIFCTFQVCELSGTLERAGCQAIPRLTRQCWRCRAPIPGSTTKTSRRLRRRVATGVCSTFSPCGCRMCTRSRRLHLRGQPVFPRSDRLAGSALDDRRHRGGFRPDESHRRAVAEIRRAVSGRGAHVVRRCGRQSRRHGPRHRRYRLVRRADLFRLQGRRGARHHAGARRDSLARRRLPRPVAARLGELSVHVAVPTSHLPQRHGNDSASSSISAGRRSMW